MTPQFFIGLADAYRSFLAHYAKPERKGMVILIHQVSPDEKALLAEVGRHFTGPARHIALNMDGWDDVDIKHIIDAAYFHYNDRALLIGNPRKYDGDGSGYAALNNWLNDSSFEDKIDLLKAAVGS
jgi:hypothetical protein